MTPTPEKSNRDQSRLKRDRALVNEILRGSVEAWHQFLTDYSTLVYHVVRRHMFAEDDDEVRTVYVDILKLLHDGAIRGYENRAYLSTWLTVFSRARTFDYLRSRNGRYREPESVQNLEPLARRVLQLYYVERQSLEIVVQTLKWDGYAIDAGDIVNAIQQIESTLDRRYLKRVDNENRLRTAGVSSVRVLKYLILLQAEYGTDATDRTPEQELLEKENRLLAQKVREAVDGLDPIERKIVKLKFENNLSASEIAQKIGFSRPRQVYSALERIVNKLRRTVAPDKPGREGAPPSG